MEKAPDGDPARGLVASQTAGLYHRTAAFKRNCAVSLFGMSPESATARRRGRPRRAETAQAIVDATLALLAENGFQATTVDAIAERAGVAKNTIYRRWDSKEELIADALEQLTRPELEVSDSGTERSP
jgi:hypothetical protein